MSYKISKGAAGSGNSWKTDRYASSLRKAEVLESMKKLPGYLGKIASLAKSPDDLIHISLSDSSASLDLEKWHLGRVVIIGDAPHGPTVSCHKDRNSQSTNCFSPIPSHKPFVSIFLDCSHLLERAATPLLVMPVSWPSTWQRRSRTSRRTRSKPTNSLHRPLRDSKASARNLVRACVEWETLYSTAPSATLSRHKLRSLPRIPSRLCCNAS